MTTGRVSQSRSTLVRNESLRRGLLVLRTLVRADGAVTTAEVARRTGIPGPTVARLLATLADEAMATRDADGGYIPARTELGGVVSGVDLSGSEPVLLVGDARINLSMVTSVKEPDPETEDPPPTGPKKLFGG